MRVFRQPDFAHAACAKLREDFVVAERLPRQRNLRQRSIWVLRQQGRGHVQGRTCEKFIIRAVLRQHLFDHLTQLVIRPASPKQKGALFARRKFQRLIEKFADAFIAFRCHVAGVI
ncbi:MAG TPA: hypothetical protein VGB07_34420 [Blastocatellia bacterium]